MTYCCLTTCKIVLPEIQFCSSAKSTYLIVILYINTCKLKILFQDDILTGTLTVKENVYLSALLRLPPEMDKDEKLEKVDEVIEELGISHVADTLVCHVL